MERALAEFQLEDGGSFLIEVPEPESENALEPVSIDGQIVYRATKSFEASIAKVQPVVSSIASKLKAGLTTPADEVEIKFGLNLSVDAGVIFSSVGGEVTFEVTLKWSSDKGQAK